MAQKIYTRVWIIKGEEKPTRHPKTIQNEDRVEEFEMYTIVSVNQYPVIKRCWNI